MQDTVGEGELMVMVVTGLGEAVSMRGGEAGMEEQEDTGDDTTSISIASSASPSPSTFTPASGATVALHPVMELQCADWTLQKWPTLSNWEDWCQYTGVWGETGLERFGTGEEQGEEKEGLGDLGGAGGAKSSWSRVSRMPSSNRESSSSRKMGMSRPFHALMG